MVRTGVNDTELIAAVRKGKRNFCDLRLLLLFKINGNGAADRTCHLIHKPAGFSEIHIFCILSDLCNFNCIQRIAAEHVVEDHPNQRLKCRR